MTWVQEQYTSVTVYPAAPTATATGITATFVSTPVEGNELICYAIARPTNASTSTNVLSMAGWTKIRQQDTTSHSIAIFHKTAGASEPTAHTMTATMTGDTSMSANLTMIEVSGPAFGDVVIDEHSNSAGASVSNWSDSFTTPNADPHFVAAIFTIRQNESVGLTWKSGEVPANDPTGAQIGTPNWIARAGWEEYAAATTDTWGVQVGSSSAQAADVIVGWKQAPVGPTPTTYVSSTSNFFQSPVGVATPAGSTGDFIIAFGGGYNTSSNPQVSGSAAFLADFTKIGRTNTSEITTAIEAYVRETDGTEDASYTLTIAGDAYSETGVMVRVTAADPNNIGVFTSENDHTVPACTVDNDGSLAVLYIKGYANAVNNTTVTAAGWTRVQTQDGNYDAIYVKAVDAGTYSASNYGSDPDAASILVILEPVQGGGNDKTATGSTSITLSASGTVTARTSSATGTSQLALAASGTATGARSATGTTSLTLAASGAAVKAGDSTGSTSLTLAASGTATQSETKAATGSTSLTFAASGTVTTRTSSASASTGLTFSADGTATGARAATGTGTLTFDTSGAAVKAGAATASTTLTFASSGTAEMAGQATGTTTLTFAASGTAVANEAATVPDAITDLAATPGDTEVVLTWTAPADGGSPITDYIVEYRVAP